MEKSTVEGTENTANVSPEEQLHESVLTVLRNIFDPEIPVNIYDLGLIYGIVIDDQAVDVQMTLTTPHCPEAQTLPPTIEAEIRSIPGVTACKVEVVWDPPWGPERMTEAARLTLGFD